mmetsp:Transcript_501/g.861  ORF Transcript_501/g.861 Transcript_501/m.861 type:complete len:439 (+) Transcript_501:34-1350(+)
MITIATIIIYFILGDSLKIPCTAAFLQSGHFIYHRLISYQSNPNPTSRSGLALSSSQKPNQEEASISQAHPDIFVLSYDGVVADTNEWRSNLAISVAFETWPQLCSDSSFVTTTTATTDENNDLEWLRNKLCALMQVTLSGEDGLLGCDAVLLARLILEEQELDEGRSNGCGGKYGSLFHPSSSQGRSTNVGSRPLTVGEIAVNWNEGACLKDTLRIKYNIDRKDPMPIIRQNILNFLQTHQPKERDKSQMLPQIHPFVSDTLLDCDHPIFILVGNECHLSTAKLSLEKLNLPICILLGDEMKNELGRTNDTHHVSQKRGIFLISPGQGERGHEGLLEDMMSSVPEGSLVHFIHSDIITLQKAKSLFGDDRPRRGMFGKCVKSTNKNVGLKLSLLSTCSGQQQQNEAEMDPWLNLMQEFDFIETLTSKVKSSGSRIWE